MDELIAEKGFYVETIKIARQNIARMKKEKAEMKAPLWDEAQGTVDAKKDFIRSKTADIDADILREEANVEYAYNMIDIVNDKIKVFTNE